MEGNIMETRNGSIKSSLSGSRGRGDSMCCAGRGARDSGPEATGTGSRRRGDLHQSLNPQRHRGVSHGHKPLASASQ